MALTNRAPALLQPGREAANTAMRLGGNATARERDYISAVSRFCGDYEKRDQWTRVGDYEKAMGEVVVRHPADTEAKILHARLLTGARSQ